MKVATGVQIADVAGILARDPRGHDMAQAVIDRRARILEGQGVGFNPCDLYADEERPSEVGYPTDYRIGAAVQEASKLRERFSGLDISHVERLASGLVVPSGCDGLIVVPKFSAVKPVKRRSLWDPSHLAMERLLGLLSETRRDFRDYTGGEIGPDHQRLDWRTHGALAYLEAVTPGDVLVFSGQTGIRFRGKSVRRSRVLLVHNEFGLDSFSAGCVVLMHSERLNRQGVLWVDCAGSKCTPDADGKFVGAPYFGFYGGRLYFGCGGVDGADDGCGSASAFLPQ